MVWWLEQPPQNWEVLASGSGCVIPENFKMVPTVLPGAQHAQMERLG